MEGQGLNEGRSWSFSVLLEDLHNGASSQGGEGGRIKERKRKSQKEEINQDWRKTSALIVMSEFVFLLNFSQAYCERSFSGRTDFQLP